MIDVSDPAHPSEAGYFIPPQPVSQVTTVGDYIYLSAGEAGLYVLQFTPSVPPTAICNTHPD